MRAVVGHAGSLEYRTVPELLVDKDYQRAVNNKRVEQIAQHFDPDVFGVLYANRRATGQIFLIDGQHRWEAVRVMHMEEWGIPCFVVSGLSRADEANVFWKINQYRLHPGSLDTFRARLQAREPAAVAIERITRDAGVHLMPYPAPLGPADVLAYATLERVWRLGVLEPMIALIREAWAYEPGAFRAACMMGVARFLLTFEGRYDPELLRGVLAAHGPRAIENRALFYKTTLSSSPPIAFARAIHHFYNEKTRDKLPAWGDQDVVSWKETP
jgi:hypothetical protein